jgi:ankyrin repeat protein
MTPGNEHDRAMKIDAAFRAGDLSALRAAVEDPGNVPNGPMPLAIGPCLEYAIYHSPIGFIRTLLEIGADPNPEDHIGFPPLVAALSCSRSQPGSPARPDVLAIIKLLLEFGDPALRTRIDDYETAREMAVNAGLLEIAEALEAGGQKS